MATDHYQAHAAEPLRSWSMIHDASAASAHWREALNCTPWLAAACSPALTMILARILSSRRLAQRWRGADGGVWGLESEDVPGHGLVVDVLDGWLWFGAEW